MSSRRSRSSQSSSSCRITDDQIMELVYKLQSLLPEHHIRSSTSKMSAAEILQDTCSYIKSLHQELDDLSERLAKVLAMTDTSNAQAEVLRGLLL